jgi:hypothetical protein
LKRGTLSPKQEFLALPLTAGTVPTITMAIRSKIAFGERGILHVQIERDGELAFAAYDGFHKECVIAYSEVSTRLLDQLIETKILHAYKRAPASPA